MRVVLSHSFLPGMSAQWEKFPWRANEKAKEKIPLRLACISRHVARRSACLLQAGLRGLAERGASRPCRQHGFYVLHESRVSKRGLYGRSIRR